MRRAVVGPDGKSWLLELRDTGFAYLQNHFFLAPLLKAIGSTPSWRATLLDAGMKVAEYESPDPAAAQAWVLSVAELIEAGLPPAA